jgi:hypothetical protein
VFTKQEHWNLQRNAELQTLHCVHKFENVNCNIYYCYMFTVLTSDFTVDWIRYKYYFYLVFGPADTILKLPNSFAVWASVSPVKYICKHCLELSNNLCLIPKIHFALLNQLWEKNFKKNIWAYKKKIKYGESKRMKNWISW